MAYQQNGMLAEALALAIIKMDPTFDFLRSDPRFQDLQRRVGLLQ